VAALIEAIKRGEPLAAQPLLKPGGGKPLFLRAVPRPAERPQFLSHPRLRRASPLSQYTAAVALEAVGNFAAPGGSSSVGVVVCLQSGPVEYASRFLQETIKDPATASPLLFPETVFAAPASHVAAVFGNVPLATTLLGDPGTFLQGLALGAEWVETKRVEACVVVGAEEINWIQADALSFFEHAGILGAGAGAVCLTGERGDSLGVQLAAITDAHTYSAGKSQMAAAKEMRSQLAEGVPAEVLCDSLGGTRFALAEKEAWEDWPGERISVKEVLGDGLMAGAAWQCVAACAGLAEGRFAAANVSVVGNNQQAIGGRFIKSRAGD
jgi:hypothetical protein